MDPFPNQQWSMVRG